MAHVSLRVDLPQGRVGPGKIALLEAVARTGSIAAAGRSLGMSYRRAWLLVEDLNATFGRPLVSARKGGHSGGGATLTALGCDLVGRYRAVELSAETAAAHHLEPLIRPSDDG